MEKAPRKSSKKSISISIPDCLYKAVRTICAKVVRFSFWETAFLCFLLRLFVAPPFGAVLALAVGCLWLYRNFETIKISARRALDTLIELDDQEKEACSVWFDEVGRDEIQSVIGRLSNERVNTCNLVQVLEDFPPEEQWEAIREELLKMQILSQTTDYAFYITWALPLD